jgi:hypothetical protein
MACSAHIFMNLATAQEHYVHSSYTEFHPHQTVNVKLIVGDLLHTKGKYGFHFVDFHETHNHGIHFGGYSFIL